MKQGTQIRIFLYWISNEIILWTIGRRMTDNVRDTSAVDKMTLSSFKWNLIVRFWLHKFKWHKVLKQTECYLNTLPTKYQRIILLDAVDGMIHLPRVRSWLFNKMFTSRISLHTIECVFKLKLKTAILRNSISHWKQRSDCN